MRDGQREGIERRLPVRGSRLRDWLDRVLRRETDEPHGAGAVLRDTHDGFVVRVALPGLRPGEIEVIVGTDHVLIGAGHVEYTPPNGSPGKTIAQQLELLLPFPQPVDGERATAELRGGVLSVRAPRAPSARGFPGADREGDPGGRTRQ